MSLSSTQRNAIAVAVAGSLHLAVAVPLTQLRMPPPVPVPVMVSILPVAPTVSTTSLPAAPKLAAPPPSALPASPPAAVAASPVMLPVAIETPAPPSPAPVSVAETGVVAAAQTVTAVAPGVPVSTVAANATHIPTATVAVASRSAGAATPAVERTEPPGYQAAYLENPQPPYPLLSRRNREQGQVRLRVLVRSDGRAETLQVHTSSGYPRLDLAASEAVRGWRFTPAHKAGRDIAGWVEVPITFSLEK
jgi:protein TonB